MNGLEARIKRLEDIHEIGQSRAKYCQYLDDGRWDELTNLFTEDGRFVAHLLRGSTGGPLAARWHFSANETVTIDGDVAHGQTWLYQPCVVEGEAHVAAGRYTDSIVRQDRQWLFSERKVTFFWWVPLAEGWEPGRIGWGPARSALDPRYTS